MSARLDLKSLAQRSSPSRPSQLVGWWSQQVRPPAGPTINSAIPIDQRYRWTSQRAQPILWATVNFRLGRIARFGSNSSVRSSAGKPRTSPPSWQLPILRSYSSKSWLVPKFSLRIYCTAREAGKALPSAATVLQIPTTTLQEWPRPKRSSSCAFTVSLAPHVRVWRTFD